MQNVKCWSGWKHLHLKLKNWFKCNDTKWCIDNNDEDGGDKLQCNQEADCADKSDEQNCGKRILIFVLSSFKFICYIR